MTRRCKALAEDGPCRQAPLNGSDFCFWHDPERADDARRARELGGKRAHREAAIAGAFNLGDLSTPEGIRRVLDIATSEALQIDDPVQRVRALTAITRNATLLLDTTDHHEGLRLIKLATKRTRR